MTIYRLGILPPKEAEQIMQAADLYRDSDMPGVWNMLASLVAAGEYSGEVTSTEFCIANRLVHSYTPRVTIRKLNGAREFAASFLGI